MAQKAVQLAQQAASNLSAISPGILIRVGSRGANTTAKFYRVLKPKVGNFAKNASVELAPPSPGEFMQQVNVLKDNLLNGKSLARVQNMTVNEFTAKGLIVIECAFWFYIGEMIGRR